ncbi:PH domain-containing protein [Sanguibacter gelidistatuariae]|uniref:PH domain-containing protein n=1 Tax=Sanguibacter gelidistatuariae TaxID=1814289 RepID=A0A1G6JIC9_9MICO|nr:PH domain-containing protein [Sanguibacter gelidistatuariae]SDC18552.1 PH domain-containing protein [Sanguibacter gelidistatuariae]
MASPKGLYEPFAPRFVRYMAWAAVVVLVGGLSIVLYLAPGTGGAGYSAGNVVGLTLVVLAGCVFLWRQATVRATVDTTGIKVRNLFWVRTYDWPHIVAVTYGSGDPWVMLELSDGHRTAMMAIQRSDGRYAAREVERLDSLVTLHGESHSTH